jgi:hypothetical protein
MTTELEEAKARLRALADGLANQMSISYATGTTYSDFKADREAQIEADLRTLLSAVDGDGWRPIETAPKDGSRILVFDEMAADNESPVVMVAWLNDAERHNRKRFAWCVPGSWQDEQGGHCTADRPTHWRPLPAPPQGAGEKGGG